jgi:hypothetical protein
MGVHDYCSAMSKATAPSRSKSASVKAPKARTATSKSAKPSTLPEKASVRTKTLRLQPSYEQGLVILKRVLKMPS